MRAASLVVAALVLLAATPASAVRVVVLDVNDGAGRSSGERNRSAVLEALERRKELELVPLARYLKTAKRKGVSSRDLDTPAGIARVAPGAGADGVLSMRLKRGVGKAVLETVVYDKGGLELWSRDIPFKGSVIPAKLASKLAAAVVAAVASVQPGGLGDPEDDDGAAPAVDRDAGRNDRDAGRNDRDAGRNDRDAGRDDRGRDDGRDAGRDDRDRDSRRDDGAEGSEGSERVDRDARGGTDEGSEGTKDDDFGAPRSVPEEDFGDKRQQRFPLLEARAGGRLTWRSYSFESVTGGTPVTYTTQTPYPGLLLDAAVYPFHTSRTRPLQGVGAQLGFSYGRLTSKFKDQQGVEQSFESADLRLTADLFYRYQIGDSPRSVVAGLRAGFDRQAFNVGENPAIVSSVRSSPRAGADVFVPLVPRLVGARAGFSWLFAPDPGTEERAIYGEDAKGSGFRGEIGVGNSLSEAGFLYEVGFDFASFSDTYAGPPSGGGKASESYYGFGASAGWAL